jgi:hypothetical protein
MARPIRFTIFKYPLIVMDEQRVSLPGGARPLSVQTQQGVLCLWALVIPGEAEESWRIRIYGTGREVDEPGLRYLGTAQQHHCVWHVFGEREGA